MILTITDQEFWEMQMAAMDDDKDEALRLIKSFIRRLEQQKHQGMKSHHARSITGIFMERYLKKGLLSVKRPVDATKKNFPCFKCHLPQVEKATDTVAAEIAAVILNKDRTTMQKLNISCMVCHQDKGIVHGLPESNVMYGPKAKKEYPEEEHMRVKKSPIMKRAVMCGQCHGLGPNLEFEHPIHWIANKVSVETP